MTIDLRLSIATAILALLPVSVCAAVALGNFDPDRQNSRQPLLVTFVDSGPSPTMCDQSGAGTVDALLGHEFRHCHDAYHPPHAPLQDLAQ